MIQLKKTLNKKQTIPVILVMGTAQFTRRACLFYMFYSKQYERKHLRKSDVTNQ